MRAFAAPPCLLLLAHTPALPAAAAPAPPRWHPGLPHGWESLPARVEDFPKSTVGGSVVYTVDPWRYDHRMGAYRTLINAAEAIQYGGVQGSPLWGLPLQHAWQMQTGRLLNTTPNTISTSSWWGAMNYGLSMVPFLAAVDAGLVAAADPAAAVRVAAPPPGPLPADAFCATHAACAREMPRAAREWRAFAAAIRAGGLPLRAAIAHLWTAHEASLADSTPIMEPIRHLLPSSEEQLFGATWGHFIGYVAALQRDLTFNETNELQVALIPPRMLLRGDRPPLIADFTVTQNTALAGMEAAYGTDLATNGTALRLWRRLCCSDEGRAAANRLANDFIADPNARPAGRAALLPLDLLRLLRDAVARYPCGAPTAPPQ